MTDNELAYIMNAIREIGKNHKKWRNDYIYNRHTNEFRHNAEPEDKTDQVRSWFELEN
jgi:hypothetical protein